MRIAAWTGSVSVLDRLSAVLDAFEGADQGLTITEISRRANLPKSTVSRFAADLIGQGYLDREGALLYLGIRLFELGQAVEHPRRLRELTRHGMLQLRDASGFHVQLAVADGDDVVVIANASGRHAYPQAARVGERIPRASTALGAACEALRHDPADSRATGSSFPAVYERAHEQHVCLASPVSNHRSVLAAISVSGPIDTVDPAALAPLVRRAAVALSRTLVA